MAGSYYHIVNEEGNFLSNDEFVGMIENLGDAYEMAEEMYGMIWYLAVSIKKPDESIQQFVKRAVQRYKDGLGIAKEIKNKPVH